MIDGTCGSRPLLYIICIYLTTIVRAPDVINNDFACLQIRLVFSFLPFNGCKKYQFKETFGHTQYTLHRNVEITWYIHHLWSAHNTLKTLYAHEWLLLTSWQFISLQYLFFMHSRIIIVKTFYRLDIIVDIAILNGYF